MVLQATQGSIFHSVGSAAAKAAEDFPTCEEKKKTFIKDIQIQLKASKTVLLFHPLMRVVTSGWTQAGLKDSLAQGGWK